MHTETIGKGLGIGGVASAEGASKSRLISVIIFSTMSPQHTKE